MVIRIREKFKKKLFDTIVIISIIRFLNFVPIPYISQQDLINLVNSNLVVQFFFNSKNVIFTIFTLGIIPNLNASIFVQFLTNSIPYFRSLQKEEGKVGKRKITQFTRIITLIIALFQSFLIALTLKPLLFFWNQDICFQIVLFLTTGSMIMLWLSDLMTEIGIVNGSSLILALNIIPTIPSIVPHFNNFQFSLNLVTIFQILSSLFVLFSIFYLQEIKIKIPLVTLRQLYRQRTYRKNKTRVFSILPLKLTQGLLIPLLSSSILLNVLRAILNHFFTFRILSVDSWLSLFLNFIFIIIFNQFYLNLVVNPKEIVKNLNKMGIRIKKIRPQQSPIIYLKQKIKSLSFIGGISLAFLNFLSQPNILCSSGFNLISLSVLIGILIPIIRKIFG
jgi:preprotein translocase subunit SecY